MSLHRTRAAEMSLAPLDATSPNVALGDCRGLPSFAYAVVRRDEVHGNVRVAAFRHAGFRRGQTSGGSDGTAMGAIEEDPAVSPSPSREGWSRPRHNLLRHSSRGRDRWIDTAVVPPNPSIRLDRFHHRRICERRGGNLLLCDRGFRLAAVCQLRNGARFLGSARQGFPARDPAPPYPT